MAGASRSSSSGEFDSGSFSSDSEEGSWSSDDSGAYSSDGSDSREVVAPSFTNAAALLGGVMPPAQQQQQQQRHQRNKGASARKRRRVGSDGEAVDDSDGSGDDSFSESYSGSDDDDGASVSSSVTSSSIVPHSRETGPSRDGSTGSGAGTMALGKDRLLRHLDPLYSEEQPEIDERRADIGQRLSGAAKIRTVDRRRLQYQTAKSEKKRMQADARRKRKRDAEALGDDAPLRQQPRTLDNTREPDDTVVRPTDYEVLQDTQTDALAKQLNSGRAPHILITTCVRPSSNTLAFVDELITVIPRCDFYRRRNYGLKEIVKFAKRRDFTDIMVIGQNRKTPNSLILTHLPDGPTATFKLSGIVHAKDIPGHGKVSGHKPELVLNNFNTRLGHTVGRMFAAMFPPVPQFTGRRVATFHNQRDYIFFRHHRYEFSENHKFKADEKLTERQLQVLSNRAKLEKEPVRVGLQELGPRFTLKLRTLQHGTFDTTKGEYEWFHRRELETSKRRFFL